MLTLRRLQKSKIHKLRTKIIELLERMLKMKTITELFAPQRINRPKRRRSNSLKKKRKSDWLGFEDALSTWTLKSSERYQVPLLA